MDYVTTNGFLKIYHPKLEILCAISSFSSLKTKRIRRHHNRFTFCVVSCIPYTTNFSYYTCLLLSLNLIHFFFPSHSSQPNSCMLHWDSYHCHSRQDLCHFLLSVRLCNCLRLSLFIIFIFLWFDGVCFCHLF